ncbi:hypothetical protein QAD02_015360 [Eretmocerus hayati]|uniref:Uncharacterized protein n=1 Tax=Eretmocerus hayati TaxID=131215 RepID=A0ACC2P901_9HYME|nr:hypothetical protein QAD02_015360 [Eretmocerus hayati]
MRPIAVLSAIPQLSHHLQLALPNAIFINLKSGQDDTVSHLTKSEIVVADVDLLMPYVDKLSETKWVQATWAGLENFVANLRNKTIAFTITRFSGIDFGYAMSEYVVSQIVNFERDQKRLYENQAKGVWDTSGRISDHRRISDLTIGVLGLGEIGSFVAKTLKGFGATIWGLSRTGSHKEEYIDKQVTTKLLPELLKASDYVINTMPSTDDTRGLLNGDVLEYCSAKKSIFINIGRGSIIRENDLINALEKKWISGAILDVFENEPLPQASKLWTLPEVVISPHVSGISRSSDIARVFAENHRRYSNGEPLKNIIDISRGY